MSTKLKNGYYPRIILILCSILVVFIAACTYNTFKDGYFREWLTMNISFIGAVLGGCLTVCGVIITLNRTLEMNEDFEQKKAHNKNIEINEKILKLKMLIKNEILSLISHYENISIYYLINQVKTHNFIEVEGKLEFFGLTPEYKLDKKFKEYIYELLMLESEKNLDSINELFLLYKNYMLINTFITSRLTRKNINLKHTRLTNTKVITDEFLSDSLFNEYAKVDEIINDYSYNERQESMIYLYDPININKIIKEYRNGSLHYNQDIDKIIKYLETTENKNESV